MDFNSSSELVKGKGSPSKILIIGDPIDTLKKASDTSLAFAQAALEEGFEAYWAEGSEVGLLNNEAIVQKTHEIFLSDEGELSFKVSSQRSFLLEDFRLILIRKDPPFDTSYHALCSLLSTTKAKILNPPETLLLYHEKTAHLQALKEGYVSKEEVIPTCVHMNLECISSFMASFDLDTQFVAKPFLGFGGQGVFHFKTREEVSHFYQKEPSLYLLQPFLPEIITRGDTRVFFIDGEILFHFTRYPPAHKITANLAQGGHARLEPLSAAQEKTCKKVGSFLQNKKIKIAGVDFIGDKLSEINLTSPTGLKTYEEMSGKNVRKKAFHSLL
jgi:glutathione synthase